MFFLDRGDIRHIWWPRNLLAERDFMMPEVEALGREAAGHLARGAISEAETSFRKGLALAPGEPSLSIGLATLYNLTGRGAVALTLLMDLTPTDPNLVAARELQFGLALLSKHEHGNALDHFDRVLVQIPANADARYGRAVALGSMGQEDEALTGLRRLLADQPSHLPAHQYLNQLLWRRKADDEFLRSYDEAEARMPGTPYFALDKATFLARADRHDEALSHYDRVLKMVPGHPFALAGRAAVLLNLNRIPEAVETYRTALAAMPGDISLLTSAAAAQLMNRAPREAEMLAGRALARAPQDQTALAVIGTAWRLTSDPRGEDLYRYDRFVRVFDLEPPKGYADMASFNRDLDVALSALHSDTREHIDQTLRNGTQTLGDLFARALPLVEALRARFVEALQTYITELPPSWDHPFLIRRGPKFGFAGSWSSRLKGEGFHTNHIHPGGWISSAYYVAVPQSVRRSRDHAGWIGFGQPSYDVGLSEPVRCWVEPKPGRLVLFPSYMWHGTKPFSGEEHRTTIAFDVVPEA
jgi:tetratricopeptide (TPR) repeat protein